MSKPTLEERVAALEEKIGAHENALSDHRKVMGSIEVFVGMASPPPATSDPQASTAHTTRHGWSHREDIDQFLHDGIPSDRKMISIPVIASLSEMTAQEPITSDPQEPYRLDTKPRDEDWTVGAAKLAQQRFGEEVKEFVASKLGAKPREDYVVRNWNMTPPGWASVGGESYNVAIDPKASPKGIPFSVALEYVRAGRRIKRSEQRHDGIGLIKGSGHTFMECNVGDKKHDIESAMWDDILANDWEVVPEP